ncbi:hypothetical protein [Nonomuraea sp. NPDC049607]|uniref:hypothetical protein n=1 Tax=unclassified Nonomuraea TaxID=2593643 RepID=UPI00344046DA
MSIVRSAGVVGQVDLGQEWRESVAPSRASAWSIPAITSWCSLLRLLAPASMAA